MVRCTDVFVFSVVGFLTILNISIIIGAENFSCDVYPKGEMWTCCKDNAEDIILDNRTERCLKNLDINPCFWDCYFNGTNVITNNEINRDVLIKFLKEDSDQVAPEWDSVHEPAVDFCLNKLKKNMNTIKENVAGIQCNSIGDSLGNCIEITYFNMCPKSIWVNTPTCKEWKNFVENCEIRQNIK